MKNRLVYLMVLVLCASKSIFSQEDLQLTPKDSIVQSAWVVGFGYNIVDDSATPFGDDFLNISDTWNALPYPSRVSLGRFFKNGIGIEVAGSYNRYKIGKTVDGQVNTALRNYYAIDGRLNYDLNKLLGETGWFDPYIQAGAGYSSIGSVGRTTGNAGFGFNTWFNDKWGLNFDTMGKWGIEEGSTKQLQHSAGVLYRFGYEKGLSKKGIEKLAVIEAFEKEKQRVADSIATANRIREEAALAERLAKEKEKARLAAIEKAKVDAENQRKKQIENRIKELGNVHFNFNSSYITKKSEEVLIALSAILKEVPTVKLTIASHTDSRGTSDYNKWLSERRMERTKDYLINKGEIASDRLKIEGHGEENLLNECNGKVPCSEEKHRINRRSEFNVSQY